MTRQQSPKRRPGSDRRLDDAIADSFPASDPPAHSGITGVRRRTADDQVAGRERSPSHRRGHDAWPTGSPTSDRHAVETANSWEDQDPS
jgi:hypothetical protein